MNSERRVIGDEVKEIVGMSVGARKCRNLKAAPRIQVLLSEIGAFLLLTMCTSPLISPVVFSLGFLSTESDFITSVDNCYKKLHEEGIVYKHLMKMQTICFLLNNEQR